MEMPNIILLDIMMPDMDGYELCQRIKKNKAAAEIVDAFINIHEEFRKIAYKYADCEEERTALNNSI
jgi:CheY-like chemotaxis protein